MKIKHDHRVYTVRAISTSGLYVRHGAQPTMYLRFSEVQVYHAV